MPADEPEPERRRPQDDGRLRARDVRDHSVPPERRAPRAGQFVEHLEAVRSGCGQHDQVGACQCLLRCCRGKIDDPGVESGRGPRSARRPGSDRPRAALLGGPRPQRARDRSADQTESQECHPHRPSIAAAPPQRWAAPSSRGPGCAPPGIVSVRPVVDAQSRARCRNPAICSRVTKDLGQNLPGAHPVVTPAARSALISSSKVLVPSSVK